jgi:hypothetical protein
MFVLGILLSIIFLSALNLASPLKMAHLYKEICKVKNAFRRKGKTIYPPSGLLQGNPLLRQSREQASLLLILNMLLTILIIST